MSSMSNAALISAGILAAVGMRLPTTIVTTVFDKAPPSGKIDAVRAWLLGSSRDVHLGGHRRTHDSGRVQQRGGHHRSAILKQRYPLVGLAADSAPCDEQVGPDGVLDRREHLGDL